MIKYHVVPILNAKEQTKYLFVELCLSIYSDDSVACRGKCLCVSKIVKAYCLTNCNWNPDCMGYMFESSETEKVT